MGLGSGGAVQWLALAFAREAGAVELAELREAIEGSLDEATRIVRSRDGVITAIREGRPLADPRSFVESARAAVAGALRDPSVSAGFGVPRQAPASLQVAALQAEQSLLLGRTLRGAGKTTAFADLGPYCFVLGQPMSDLREFCARVLGPLSEEHEDLVQTLETYLRCHGSLNEVARRLYLHRNTVRQRLRRVAALTGADLNDADARLALQLAVLGRRAISQISAR